MMRVRSLYVGSGQRFCTAVRRAAARWQGAAAVVVMLVPAGHRPSRATEPDSGRARAVRVCAGGDVALGTNLDTSWVARATRWAHRAPRALPEPGALLAPLAPMVRGADVVLLNLEGAIGDDSVVAKCHQSSTGCFALRMPARTAPALRRLSDRGVVVANVANNHARDAGAAGLAHTIALLTDAGVYVTGADTLATPVVTARGDTVAVLGFSASGTPDARDLAAVRRHVARAAARWRRVIVTMHVGAEGSDAQRTRDTMERFLDERRGNPVAFARAAVAAGADLVLGHGPHVVRAMEWRRDALVAYSLGNLVTYGPFDLDEPLDRGALLCASLGPSGRVTRARLRATKLRWPGWVSVDRSARAAVLVDSLSRLDFPESGARVRARTVVTRP